MRLLGITILIALILLGIESLIYNGYITFIDNSGESTENSIKILHAKGEDDGIASEYYYLQSRYGRPKVDWNLNSQSTVAANGRAYDKMDIQLSDGMRKTIYFDITGFFGKFNRLSLKEINDMGISLCSFSHIFL